LTGTTADSLGQPEPLLLKRSVQITENRENSRGRQKDREKSIGLPERKGRIN